ncbi:MAG TPA: hypothetical protein DCE41_35185 [Cytophagales bacterium]|nr:hypothetical protein [Cytophagales bacterium]HAP58643.1 hypothetical protein [Cytophagales bacterium]
MFIIPNMQGRIQVVNTRKNRVLRATILDQFPNYLRFDGGQLQFTMDDNEADQQVWNNVF